MNIQMPKTVEESKLWGGGPKQTEDGPVVLFNNSDVEIEAYNAIF